MLEATYSHFERVTPDQGGLLSGKDPTAFNTADPLRIWIIQVVIGVIMLTTQLLSLLLRNVRQPRVIAEVLGGIILGPTACGRIPGFTKHIFPSETIPYLSLVANIGLVLFLFLVGLEIDGNLIKRNVRLSTSIALGGMVVPFGLGSAFAVALYREFVDPRTKFTHFLLFVGVAFSITAFPVLCRILTELKLLDTTVGVVVLSAGVANDLVGWTLLALSVALVNAGSGLTALWVLLACVGWTLFLLFPVRRAFLWLAHRTGSIENGPTMSFMTATMLMVFGSAFFTDVIGVHAIFGGFLGGLIIPRDGGLAIAITEKLEDMVSIIFLPLYFTLSGLSTDLGLLNNGITWAYTIGIVVLAYIGKFGGCTIAARFTGFRWREATSIGTLMSCKGLVELIVLNVGLAAGILDTRVFSMFVLEALMLTVMTTPVVVKLYPPKFRKRAVAAGANFDSVEEKEPEKDGSLVRATATENGDWKTHFTVVLDKMEHLPGIMSVVQLFRPSALDAHKGRAPDDSMGIPASSTCSAQLTKTPPVIDALRLIELSDRTSAVMKSSVADSLIHADPLINIFRTFSEINDIPASPSLSVVTFDELAAKVAEHAKENGSQLVLVPWLLHTIPTVQPKLEHNPQASGTPSTTPINSVDALLNFGIAEQSSSAVHSQFVRGVFTQSSVDVALFVDRGRACPGHYSKQHICLPFFGGPDDRLALSLVVQLCGNPGTTASVFRVRVLKGHSIVNKPDLPELVHTASKDKHAQTHTAARENVFNVHSVSEFPDTVHGSATTQTRLQSEIADNFSWQSFASPSPSSALSPMIRAALTRVEFSDLASPTPLHEVLVRAMSETEIAVQQKARPFIVVGRARRLAMEYPCADLRDLLEENTHVHSEVKETLGDVATAFVVSGNTAGLLVVQAAGISRGD